REPIPDEAFGDAWARAAVAVGGIEEVDALGMRGIHHPERLGLVGGPAEVHRAEAEAADGKAGAAQMGVLHVGFPGEARTGPGAGRVHRKETMDPRPAPPPRSSRDQPSASST